jgi:hypothetical protein
MLKTTPLFSIKLIKLEEGTSTSFNRAKMRPE